MTRKKIIASIAVRMVKNRQTLALAESCTGGLIASHIVAMAGASNYFSGGLVSYANHTKHDLLGVSKAVLKNRGAVSREAAEQMAKGAKKIFRSQWAIAVTGIAGPAGGTKIKPVGLVYYAVAGPGIVSVKKNVFRGSRKKIQNSAMTAALQLLSRLLV